MASGISARRSSASGDAGAAAQRGTAVAELLGLHRLPLAAVGDGIDPEVAPDGVDVQQEISRVGGDATVAVQTAEAAALDLVDLARRDAEVLAALGDRRNPVADQIVAVLDVADDVARVVGAALED